MSTVTFLQKKTASIFINLFLVGFTLSLVLIAADRAIHHFLHIPSSYLKSIVRFDSALSPTKRLKPNLETIATGDFNEFIFHVHTDAESFRKSYAPALARDAEVLFLGDSQTFGIGVSDDETYASVFAKESGVSVLNTGCPGYNTFEEYRLLEDLLNRHKPEKIVLGFFAGNDPYENSRYQMSSDEKGLSNQSPGLNQILTLSSFKSFLVRNSSIYHLLIRLRRFNFFNDKLKKIGLVNVERPAELHIFNKTSAEKTIHWQRTEEALLKIQKLAQKKNIPLVVLFIPDRYQVDKDYWQQWIQKYSLNPAEYDLNLPNLYLKTFCLQHSILFLDPTEALRQKQSENASVYWKIDNHLSVVGHEVIVKFLKNRLL